MTTSSESTTYVSFMYLVPLKYLSTLLNLTQSSSSGSFTLVAINKTSVCMSLLDLVLMNKNCATVWWNISALSLSNILYSSSTLIWDRLFASGVADVSLKYSGNYSSIFWRYGFKPSSDQVVFWQKKLDTPHWICFDWQLLDFLSYQLGINTPDITENELFIDMLYAGDCSWS